MTDHTPTPDTMCTCGHGAASAHDIDNSVSAFTACVVSGCTCKAFTPAPEAATRAVQGYCPACGWTTLFLGDGGYVTCSRIDCPVPDAASTLLERDPRTTPKAPATKPCQATYETPTASATHQPERGPATTVTPDPDHPDGCPGCETCDLATQLADERAAHEEHRRQLAGALGGLGPDTPWDSLIRRAAQVLAGRHRAFDMAQEIEADRDRLAAELEYARAVASQYAAAESADAAAGSYAHRAEQAEAALNRVWDLADRWEHALAPDLPYARALRVALDGEQPAAEPSPRCVCGDPIQRWTGPGEPGWIHSPGSDTRCTDPRPRCTCAGVGFGTGDCAAHPPEPDPAPSEACCVCGSRNVLHQVVTPTRLCGDCFLCRCGETPCVRTGVNDPAVSAESEEPCFHPSWETEPTVGARKCTDCDEWLDPQPTPAKPDGAALWAAIRDHAFNDTQWWRKVNRRRDHAQLNTYVQRGPGHTPTR